MDPIRFGIIGMGVQGSLYGAILAGPPLQRNRIQYLFAATDGARGLKFSCVQTRERHLYSHEVCVIISSSKEKEW